MGVNSLSSVKSLDDIIEQTPTKDEYNDVLEPSSTKEPFIKESLHELECKRDKNFANGQLFGGGEVEEFEAERAVGMTEFINPNWTGFTGIIKHRDFVVSEVGLNGKVAQLSETLCEPTIAPKDPKKEKIEELVTLDCIQLAFSSVIDQQEFFQALQDYSTKMPPYVNDDGINTPALNSKEERTKVHQAIRQLFKGSLLSETDGERIRIYRRSRMGDKRKRDDRNLQSADQQRFLSFVLYKENMDTIEAIQTIAKRLHMSAKDFSYAGTKDRRARTVQHMVARNLTPAKLLGINRLFEDGRLRVSDISPATGPLSLGDLQGNRFDLIIRNIQGHHEDDSLLTRVISNFGKSGFINYFGLQRFGTSTIPSHMIGTALLQGNWREAVSLILEPRQGEGDVRAIEAREYWKRTRNAREAQNLFPTRYTAERQILAHYARSPEEGTCNDHMGAILAVNRELRLMYVHSVQSFIWNQMASKRHQLYGKVLTEGDLVWPASSSEPFLLTVDKVTDYNIDDLVLPMPGYATKFPQNQLGDLYKAALAELNIPSLEAAFKPVNKALWDLPGAYRRVYVIPRDLKFKLGYYENPDSQLDIDSIIESPAVSTKYRGLYMAFTLPASAYATMALRELMHASTDPRQHKALTKQHQSDSKT